MRVYDVVYCTNPETYEMLFDYYTKKGYAVMQSTVQIESGTHGWHTVKRLDILERDVTTEEEELWN